MFGMLWAALRNAARSQEPSAGAMAMRAFCRATARSYRSIFSVVGCAVAVGAIAALTYCLIELD